MVKQYGAMLKKLRNKEKRAYLKLRGAYLKC